MKQMLILKDVVLPRYKTGTTPYTHIDDLSAIADGSLMAFDAASGALISLPTAAASKATKDFYLMMTRGANNPVIELLCNKDFTVNKSTFVAGVNKVATLQIPTTVAGVEYTVILAKKGQEFNKRFTWTGCATAEDSSSANAVATAIKNALAANSGEHGVTVTVSTDTITFTGTNFGDFEVTNDFGGTYTVTTSLTMPQNTTDEIKELFRSTIGSRGYEYTKEDKDEIYPGYAKDMARISNTGYTVYTLRFANDRKVTTGGPNVYQTVHICVVEKTTDASTGATHYTNTTGALDKLFGLS